MWKANMLVLIISLFLISVLILINRGKWSTLNAPLISLLLLSLFVYLLSFLGTGPVLIEETNKWSDALGVELAFRLDSISMLFALLITGIGSGVFAYSAAYFKNEGVKPAFVALLTVFTASMLGLVLSNNLLLMFIFWELTSVCSYLLIGLDHRNSVARYKARKALFVTAGGGLLLLVCIILTGIAQQSLGFSLIEAMTISNLDGRLETHHLQPYILATLAIAVATKSAQSPFHFWLPHAMAGPTPVSSFLHSATMVKAGIYLLVRFFPALGGSEMWFLTFTIMGTLTMLVGAVFAIRQKDIKYILAYSTISILGALVLLLGLGTEKTIAAMTVLLVAHALYKAALFQIAGAIDKATGTRDLDKLYGLSKYFPVLAVAAVLSTLSMAGAPPMLGFFSKELMYMAKVKLDYLSTPLLTTAMLANLVMVALAVKVMINPFWGQPQKSGLRVIKIQPLLIFIPFVFSIVSLLLGLFPKWFASNLGSNFASIILDKPVNLSLKLWHGWESDDLVVLGLSVSTLGIGTLMAGRLSRVSRGLKHIIQSSKILGPDVWFDYFLNSLPATATRVTDLVQSGDLRHYLRLVLLGIGACLIWPVTNLLVSGDYHTSFSLVELLIFALVLVPATLCLYFADGIKRTIYLGVAGLSLVFAFTILGAPDLALTQLMVETLSVIFIIVLLREQKKKQKLASNKVWPRLVLASLVTLPIALILLSKFPVIPIDLADYYANKSFSQAYGKNIVNVILVDFRALDTFGEVLAIAIATFGTGVLLQQTRHQKGEG